MYQVSENSGIIVINPNDAGADICPNLQIEKQKFTWVERQVSGGGKVGIRWVVPGACFTITLYCLH